MARRLHSAPTLPMNAPTSTEPGVGDGATVASSFERLLATGQQLVEHRLELLSFDARLRAAASARGMGALAAGAVVLLLGWIALMIALVSSLVARIGFEAALVIVGAAHAIAGVSVLAWGLHALRGRAGD